MLLLLKTEGAVTSFFKAQRTALLDLSEIVVFCSRRGRRGIDQLPTVNGIFFPPSLLFLFVFHFIPRRMVVFISIAHQVQPTRQVQGERVTCDGEGQARGMLQGRREPCLRMTSGRCGADPHGISSRFLHWGAEDDTAGRRVSEPRFNKPSAAPGPIPRKLVNAVSCQGSVHLRQGESAATPQPCGCQGRSFIH